MRLKSNDHNEANGVINQKRERMDRVVGINKGADNEGHKTWG